MATDVPPETDLIPGQNGPATVNDQIINLNNNYNRNILKELRLRAEEDRRQILSSLNGHKEELLKELFVLMARGEVNHPDVMAFLDKADEVDDPEQWDAFLEKYESGEISVETETDDSAPPLAQAEDQRVSPDQPLTETRPVQDTETAIANSAQGNTLEDEKERAHSRTESGASHGPNKTATFQRTTVPVLRMPDAKNYPPQTYNGVSFTDYDSEKSEGLDLYAWQLRANAQPLSKTLQTACKTVTTRDWTLAWEELKMVKAVQAIEDLKKKNMWSLRQPKRHKSVPRTKTHWDYLLDEMKWMRTDFREERKWKIATAYMVAHAVLDWHLAEDKGALCVKTYIPDTKAQPTVTKQDAKEDVASTSLPKSETDVVGAVEDSAEATMESEDTRIVKAKEGDYLNIFTPSDTSDQPEGSTEATVPPPTLPHEIVQKYRATIRDLDPNLPIVTLPVEEFGDFDIHSVFPDLLLYEPPNPNYNDPYFDEAEYGRIVAITKLATKKMTFKKNQRLSRKRDIDGMHVVVCDDEESKQEVRTLPRNERYDNTPLVSQLFAPKKIKDTPVAQPPTPTTPGDPKNIGIWTEDDDLCLIQLIVQYSFNWSLITDAFNSIRVPVTGEHRTPWQLHERWRQNNLTSLSGQVSPAYASKLKKDAAKRLSLVRLDSARKRQRQYNIFEAIKKSQKKREEAQKPASTASTTTLRRTIETHGMSSTGQRLFTPMELSLHKAQRDRQVAQAIMEQRQLTAGYGLSSQPGNNQHHHHPPRSLPQGAPVVHSSMSGQPRPTPAAVPAVSMPVNGSLPTAGAVTGTPNRQMASVPSRHMSPAAIPTSQGAVAPQNRYPEAQLHMMRQRQMALMAAAQAQGRPPVSAPIQRFNNVLAGQQQQVPRSYANNGNDGLPHQSHPVTSAALQQQQGASMPHIPQQQQHHHQPQTSAGIHSSSVNSLAMAAQLFQLGYPIQQLQPNQQVRLQQYLQHMRLRNAANQAHMHAQAAAAAAANGAQPLTQIPQMTAGQHQQQQQQLANSGLQAALLAAQQQQQQQQQQVLQQRFQQAQLQQALQMQHQQQQQNNSPHHHFVQQQQYLQQFQQQQNRQPQQGSSMMQPGPYGPPHV